LGGVAPIALDNLNDEVKLETFGGIELAAAMFLATPLYLFAFELLDAGIVSLSRPEFNLEKGPFFQGIFDPPPALVQLVGRLELRPALDSGEWTHTYNACWESPWAVRPRKLGNASRGKGPSFWCAWELVCLGRREGAGIEDQSGNTE
jgi:hypothetical protein